MELLPDEIVREILDYARGSYVTARMIPTVCVRWRNICTEFTSDARAHMDVVEMVCVDAHALIRNIHCIMRNNLDIVCGWRRLA